MIKDMTVGNPSRILLGFSLPMILSGMFQQLYNIVDSVVAGQFAGVNALAAVGLSLIHISAWAASMISWSGN